MATYTLTQERDNKVEDLYEGSSLVELCKYIFHNKFSKNYLYIFYADTKLHFTDQFAYMFDAFFEASIVCSEANAKWGYVPDSVVQRETRRSKSDLMDKLRMINYMDHNDGLQYLSDTMQIVFDERKAGRSIPLTDANYDCFICLID